VLLAKPGETPRSHQSGTGGVGSGLGLGTGVTATAAFILGPPSTNHSRGSTFGAGVNSNATKGACETNGPVLVHMSPTVNTSIMSSTRAVSLDLTDSTAFASTAAGPASPAHSTNSPATTGVTSQLQRSPSPIGLLQRGSVAVRVSNAPKPSSRAQPN
jgi:hypothetical protein